MSGVWEKKEPTAQNSLGWRGQRGAERQLKENKKAGNLKRVT